MDTNYLDSNIHTFFEGFNTSELTKSYRILHTPSEFAKENLFYIQEVGYLKSLKSHISKREQLNSYLFLIVLSGKGRLHYREKNYKLTSGDCILINCNYSYSHESSEDDPWELEWVHFNGEHITPYMTYYETEHNDVVFRTDTPKDYTTIIEACLRLEKKKDISSEFMISKLLTDLLTLSVMKKVARENNSSSKMNLVKEYIDKHFQEKISLSSVSDELYISKHYLAREFKKAYGITIGDYITIKRITYSKELLRFTKKSIEEISVLCGIADTNYFTKVFKKLEDCTPTDYRRKW